MASERIRLGESLMSSTRPAATALAGVAEMERQWAEFEFSLAGEYNVLNATAAAAMAANYGIGKESIAAALTDFRSVKRRLEVKAEIHGITIIDDFAHHPTAIAETLKAVRTRYPGRRLWAILEPRSNTLRRKVFQHELAAEPHGGRPSRAGRRLQVRGNSGASSGSTRSPWSPP